MSMICQTLGCGRWTRAADGGGAAAIRRHLRGKRGRGIRAMADAGMPIKEIVRRTGRSRKLVRAVVRGSADECSVRERAADGAPPVAGNDMSNDCRNSAELWRRLRADGFRAACAWSPSGLRAGAQRTGRRRHHAQTAIGTVCRASHAEFARPIDAQSVIVAAAERAVPSLTEARVVVDRFHAMLRSAQRRRCRPGSSTPATACWRRSAVASCLIGPPSMPRSPVRGRTARRKGKSPSSSCCAARCTVAAAQPPTGTTPRSRGPSGRARKVSQSPGGCLFTRWRRPVLRSHRIRCKASGSGKMASSAPSLRWTPPWARDYRLDFFRAVALVFIFMDQSRITRSAT